MHVLQRLVHDVGMVVNVASNTARMMQRAHAHKSGEVASWAADDSTDVIGQMNADFNRELAGSAQESAVDDELSKLNFMQLKKHLIGIGIPKATVFKQTNKPALLRLHKQFIEGQAE